MTAGVAVVASWVMVIGSLRQMSLGYIELRFEAQFET